MFWSASLNLDNITKLYWVTQRYKKKEETLIEKMKRSPDERHTEA